MRLIVHAGPGKTGSTAIQKSLRNARAALQARGVLYLGLMFEHGPVQRHAWQRPGGFEAFHKLPAAEATAQMAALMADTAAAAAASGVDTLVLSNESLFRRHAAFLEALARFRAAGHEVLAIAYARRYDELARSSYLQWGISHKTYAGPLKSFREWMDGRDIGLSRSAKEWRQRLGRAFQLRNLHASPDVVRDFLQAAGLPEDAVTPLRTYTTPGTNEIALRALFNAGSPAPVSPTRFTRLFGSAQLSFDQPLGAWLSGLLPDRDALSELGARLAGDRASVDALLRECGQPPLGDAEPQAEPPALDRDALITTLFQMLAQQALRIEALEERIAGAAPPAPTSAVAAQPPAPAQAPAVPPALPAAAVDALAPALGYFGAHDQDCLRLPLPAGVREIRLSIHEPKPTFLNLRSLQLLRGGKPLALPDDGWTATQSSVSGSEARNGADGLLKLRGIHSGAESEPWWQVRFAQPVGAEQLVLCNRSDGWGSRSRSLAVDVVDAQGRAARIHDGRSPAALASVLQAAFAAAGIAPAPVPADVAAAAALRGRLLAAIAARLRTGALGRGPCDWRLLVQLLPAWGTDVVHDDEWTLLAGFLLAQQRAKGPTSIKAFSLLLSTQARLRRLQDELTALSAAAGGGTLMLTRHGIKPEGVLRQHPERFLEHLQGVLRALEAMGYEAVVAYGTLLGAVRDRHFIAHDDDVDLMFRSRAHDRAGVEAEQASVMAALRERGYKVVSLLPDSLNIHVIEPRNGAVMDVFPCWLEDGRMQMHMEGMKVRGIAPEIMFPPSRATLLDREFPAPADPAAFLGERYGDGWRQPDQFFEWPWPLAPEPAA